MEHDDLSILETKFEEDFLEKHIIYNNIKSISKVQYDRRDFTYKRESIIYEKDNCSFENDNPKLCVFGNSFQVIINNNQIHSYTIYPYKKIQYYIKKSKNYYTLILYNIYNISNEYIDRKPYYSFDYEDYPVDLKIEIFEDNIEQIIKSIVSINHTIDLKQNNYLSLINSYINKIIQDQKMKKLIISYIKKLPSQYFMHQNIIQSFEIDLYNYLESLIIDTGENSDMWILNEFYKNIFCCEIYENWHQKKGTYYIITQASTRWSLTQHNFNNTIENYLYDYFLMLVDLINKYYNFPNQLTAIFITYKLLILNSIDYFSNLWLQEYKNYFPKNNTFSLYENIDIFNNLNINYDNLAKEKFTFYLMKNQKFNTNNYNILECLDILNENIEEKNQKNYLDDFEKKLLDEYEKNNISSKFSIHDIDLMTGREFEIFIGTLFEKMGYIVEITQCSGDQGIDILIEKNNQKIGVQVKCYSNKVTNKAIQEVTAGLNYYNCDKGMVITNNYYTNSAIELSEANNIVLWDRDMLKQLLDEFNN
ncbi:restriction endonuclease [Clostridium botulinum]|uniref:restriction endonuclease n=1 Tax=Clostridium botulinum TaxID=1491 RepID=UPI00192CECFE|nr:restriction endonuclease [Clostridium botulinum]